MFRAALVLPLFSVGLAQKPAEQLNTQCLLFNGLGCEAIQGETECLNSRDGRFFEFLNGRRVRGEPCVWCGGKNCPGLESKCAPYEIVVGNPEHPQLPEKFEVANCWDYRSIQDTINRVPSFQQYTPTAAPFTAVNSGEGQACRGMSASDRGEGSMVYGSEQWSYVIWSATSLEHCQALCGKKCVAVEYNAADKYCEAWLDLVENSAAVPGYQCFSKKTDCLQPVAEGCGALTTKTNCLHSQDGRQSLAFSQTGLGVYESPCVWCEDGQCHDRSPARCQPLSLLVRGYGRAYDKFLSINNFEIATCETAYKTYPDTETSTPETSPFSVPAITPAGSATSKSAEAANAAADAAHDVVVESSNAASKAANAAAAGAAGAAGGAAAAATGALATAASAGSSAGNTLSSQASGFGDWASQAGQAAGDAAASAGQAARDAASSAGQAANDAASSANQAANDAASSANQAANDAAASANQAANDAFASANNAAASANQAANGAVDSASQAANNAATTANDIASAAAATADDANDALGNTDFHLNKAADQAATAIDNMVEGADGTANSAADNAKNAAASLAGSAGQSSVGGPAGVGAVAGTGAGAFQKEPVAAGSSGSEGWGAVASGSGSTGASSDADSDSDADAEAATFASTPEAGAMGEAAATDASTAAQGAIAGANAAGEAATTNAAAGVEGAVAGANAAGDAAASAAADAKEAAADAAGAMAVAQATPEGVAPAAVGGTATSAAEGAATGLAGAAGAAAGAAGAAAAGAAGAADAAAAGAAAASKDTDVNSLVAGAGAGPGGDGTGSTGSASVPTQQVPLAVLPTAAPYGGHFVRLQGNDSNPVYWHDSVGLHSLAEGVECANCGCSENVDLLSKDQFDAVPMSFERFHCVALHPPAPASTIGHKMVPILGQFVQAKATDAEEQAHALVGTEKGPGVGVDAGRKYWQDPAGTLHPVSPYEPCECCKSNPVHEMKPDTVAELPLGAQFSCDMIGGVAAFVPTANAKKGDLGAYPVTNVTGGSKTVAVTERDHPAPLGWVIFFLLVAIALGLLMILCLKICQSNKKNKDADEGYRSIRTLLQCGGVADSEDSSDMEAQEETKVVKPKKKVTMMDPPEDDGKSALLGANMAPIAPRPAPAPLPAASIQTAPNLKGRSLNLGAAAPAAATIRSAPVAVPTGSISMTAPITYAAPAAPAFGSGIMGSQSYVMGGQQVLSAPHEPMSGSGIIPAAAGSMTFVGGAAAAAAAASGSQRLSVFDQIDQNHDGVLSREEWQKYAFDAMDANHDGKVSPQEWQASGIGSMAPH